MSLSRDVERDLVELLAKVYRSVRWGKMRTSKNPHDIYNHRVRAAARSAGLHAMISRLCNYFSIQSLPHVEEVSALMAALRPHERDILRALSSEHIPLCIMAIERAYAMRREAQGSGGKDDVESAHEPVASEKNNLQPKLFEEGK